MSNLSGYTQVGGIYALPGEKTQGFLCATTPAGNVEMPVAVVSGKQAGPRLTVVGGIHGGEYAGIEAALSVTRDLDPDSLTGVVISVGLVNVPAFRQHTVYVCPLDGKNLTRVFPGNRKGSPSEVIADVLQREVIAQSDYVIELHGGDLIEDLVPFVIHNHTGNDEVDQQSLAIARSYGTTYIVEAPSWDGRFTNKGALYVAACEEGKPAILAEAGSQGRVDAEAVQTHVNGIKSCMRLLGMSPGTPLKTPNQRMTSRYVSMRAPASGLLRPQVAAGDTIAQGTVVAEIRDYFGNRQLEVYAPISGTVLFAVTSLSINSGETLMGIADFAATSAGY